MRVDVFELLLFFFGCASTSLGRFGFERFRVYGLVSATEVESLRHCRNVF